MKKTIAAVESQLQQTLSTTTIQDILGVPEGYRICVSLYGKGKKVHKMRYSASADNWSPASGHLEVRFELEEVKRASSKAATPDVRIPELRNPSAAVSSPIAPTKSEGSDPVADLVRVLDRTESRPGYDFVALKWFRDTALMSAGLEWTDSDTTRQSVLHNAIEKKLILTGKTQNPKSPQFPVTTIRLNRLLPEVKSILGEASAPNVDFQPIAIRGESLSTTILRERR